MRRGLVKLVAAPSVAVQSNTGTTGSVAFDADEIRACNLLPSLEPVAMSQLFYQIETPLAESWML